MFRELIYFRNKKKGFLWGISRDWFFKFSQHHSIIQVMSLAGSVKKTKFIINLFMDFVKPSFCGCFR